MAIPTSERPGWIDVSQPVHADMVHWPGNTPVVVEQIMSLDQGDACNLTKVSMSWHTGTHMDAPAHFAAWGKTIDQFPVEAMVGPALVIAIRDAESVKVAELTSHRIRKGARVLFKTRNSARCAGLDRFVEDYVFISREAAGYLVDREVSLVGIDYLSVGGFLQDGNETHQVLLGGGVWVIEGLDLSKVKPGPHQMVAAPLRIQRGDGAPARVLLRPSPSR